MHRLGDVVDKVRSKNAGPFWITVDIFCGDSAVFARVEEALTTQAVAEALRRPTQTMKRFALPDLNVVKFSFPREHVQGSRLDRDMHGAQFALVIADLPI